jgi:MFS transporter, DHA2 family, methylenomycin A resistance protein
MFREAAKRSGHRLEGMLPLLAVSLGYLMVILDATAVTVALPALRADLGGGVSGLEWVVDGYTLVFAALLLSAGALGDRIGTRRVFFAGLSVFTLASAGCGAAPSVAALVAARVLQGAGAALLVPSSLALLRAAYPDQAARARAIGAWGGIGGIGAASGPVLGGALVTAVSWRAVFLVNVPVALVALVLTLRCVPAPARPERARRLDLGPQVLVIAGLGALTLALIEAGPRGWSDPLVLTGFAAAAVALAAFVAAERRVPDPMLPLGLFRAPTFGGGSAVGLLINLGFYGQLFVVNLALQQERGYGALEAGLALLPEALMAIVGSTLAGRAVARHGARGPTLAGLAIGAAGLIALAEAAPHAPYALLVPGLLATGFGMSFTMPAATAAVIESAPADRAGVASGVLNAARQVGGTIGVALLGSIVVAGASLQPALLVAAAAFGVGALVTAASVERGGVLARA